MIEYHVKPPSDPYTHFGHFCRISLPSALYNSRTLPKMNLTGFPSGAVDQALAPGLKERLPGFRDLLETLSGSGVILLLGANRFIGCSQVRDRV